MEGEFVRWVLDLIKYLVSWAQSTLDPILQLLFSNFFVRTFINMLRLVFFFIPEIERWSILSSVICESSINQVRGLIFNLMTPVYRGGLAYFTQQSWLNSRFRAHDISMNIGDNTIHFLNIVREGGSQERSAYIISEYNPVLSAIAYWSLQHPVLYRTHSFSLIYKERESYAMRMSRLYLFCLKGKWNLLYQPIDGLWVCVPDILKYTYCLNLNLSNIYQAIQYKADIAENEESFDIVSLSREEDVVLDSGWKSVKQDKEDEEDEDLLLMSVTFFKVPYQSLQFQYPSLIVKKAFLFDLLERWRCSLGLEVSLESSKNILSVFVSECSLEYIINHE